MDRNNIGEQEFLEAIEKCAYKDENDITDEERKLRAIERKRCKSFVYFLKYVKIIEPPTPGKTGGGVIPLILWPHIKEIIVALLKQTLVTVLKARQIGISTIIAAYVLWFALFNIGANILLFSKGQPEAKELLAKARRIYNQLPPFLRLKLDPDSTEEIGFPVMQSAIKAFPSTQSAGISYTASIVVCDEHAEHPYADENYISSKPTRDRGGQFISVFTEDPFSNDNLATAIFEDAIAEKNDFKPLFFPYDVVPGRDEDWYEHTKKNIPDRELGKLSPELYMAKNYPRSIEEALETAKSVAVFDKKALNIMKYDIRGQINEGDGWGELDNEICHIYKDYHIGNFYIASSDVGWGLKSDFSVTGIMDVKTGDIVADIMRNDLPPDKFTYHSVALLRHYRNPLWWIEHNIPGGGRDVIKKAIELGYKKLGYRGDKPINWNNIGDNEVLKRVGFFTDEKNRADLFGALIPDINDLQVRIYNELGLEQFKSMIRNANNKGRIEAMSSKHDDYVIMVGICRLKMGDVQTSSSPMKPLETLTFKEKHPSVIQRLIDKQLQGVSND